MELVKCLQQSPMSTYFPNSFVFSVSPINRHLWVCVFFFFFPHVLDVYMRVPSCTGTHRVTRHKNSQFHSPITTDFYELLGSKNAPWFRLRYRLEALQKDGHGALGPRGIPAAPVPDPSKGKPLCGISEGRKSLGSCELRASLSRPYH